VNSTVSLAAIGMGQSSREAAPIYGIHIPGGSRGWLSVSVNHLAGSGVKTGARPIPQRPPIKALRDGNLPFPDGTGQA